MAKKIVVLSASPQRNGTTDTLVAWFSEGARAQGAEIDIIRTADLKYATTGCTSCRACQASKTYTCVIPDEATPILTKMAQADVIVIATPLYFFSASAQIKLIMDRMFSLYKWDNNANTMTTPLKGKTLILLASAYEDIGLDALEKPFALTADYTGMTFKSLLVANAGESGEIHKLSGLREKAVALGQEAAG